MNTYCLAHHKHNKDFGNRQNNTPLNAEPGVTSIDRHKLSMHIKFKYYHTRSCMEHIALYPCNNVTTHENVPASPINSCFSHFAFTTRI